MLFFLRESANPPPPCILELAAKRQALGWRDNSCSPKLCNVGNISRPESWESCPKYKDGPFSIPDKRQNWEVWGGLLLLKWTRGHCFAYLHPNPERVVFVRLNCFTRKTLKMFKGKELGRNIPSIIIIHSVERSRIQENLSHRALFCFLPWLQLPAWGENGVWEWRCSGLRRHCWSTSASPVNGTKHIKPRGLLHTVYEPFSTHC